MSDLTQSHSAGLNRKRMLFRGLSLLGTATLMIAALLYFVLDAPINYNEHMYLAASVLFTKYRLYRDFAYLQTPLLPMVYGLFFKLTGTTWYLLTGRCFTLFFVLASGIFMFLVFLKTSRDFFLALMIGLLLCLNDLLMFPMKECSNYLMPVALSLAAFYFFSTGAEREGAAASRGRMLLSGILTALAVDAKILYGPLALAFILTGLSRPAPLPVAERIKKVVLPFLIGFALGLVPIYYYALADFRRFRFGNFDYHFLVAGTKTAAPDWPRVFMPEKFRYTASLFLNCPANSIMMVLLVLALAASALQGKFRNSQMPLGFVLAAISAIIMTLVLFIPTPMWIQYFAMPLPFLLLLAGFGLAGLKRFRVAGRILLMLAALATVGIFMPKLAGFSRLFTDFSSLRSVAVHRQAQLMRQMVRPVRPGDKIATIFPAYVLDSGVDTYREFATGLFLWDLSRTVRLDRDGLVFNPDLAELFAHDPPRAILVSNTPFDPEFGKYAVSHGYHRVQWGFEGFSFLVKE